VKHRLSTLALGALLPLLAARCASEDVVVAEILPAPSGQGGAPEGQPCVDNAACAASFSYCHKETCGASSGVCRPRPISCPSDRDEQCGCDGVNYWNDCLREQAGVPGRAGGQCVGGEAQPCGAPGQPPCSAAGATCARLLPPELECGPAAPGACWVLPAACPASSSPPVWEPCGAGPCVDVCQAIAAGAPHRLHPGPGCGQGPH
jgi:hypothetical protein